MSWRDGPYGTRRPSFTERAMKGGPTMNKILTYGGTVVATILLIGIILSGCGYITAVGEDEVIVRFDAGKIIEVAGAGMHADFGPFKSAKTYKRSAIPFSVTDPEVLTKAPEDEAEGEEALTARIGQAIGLLVAGDVMRPNTAKADFIRINWGQYKTYYVDDEALVALMERLTKQAMKVCVGERTFEKAAVGEARDELRLCIDEEVSKLASNYGLDVVNLVVPDVILNENQKGLVADLGDAKIKTDLARWQKLQAIAEGERDAAVEKAKIRVEQAKVQEKASQDAITWVLKQSAAKAEYATIEAQKDNEKLTADRNYLIAQVERRTAEQKALAELSPEIARAQLLGANPAYVQLLQVQALAAAYKVTDKIILPANVSPLMVLGQGVMPTFPVTPTSGAQP